MSLVSGILSQGQKVQHVRWAELAPGGAVEYEESNHTQIQKHKEPRKSEQGVERSPYRGGELGRGHVATSLSGDASGCTQLCSGRKEMSGTSTNFLNHRASYTNF